MKLHLIISFLTLSKLLFAGPTAFIDPKTMSGFRFQEKLVEAIKQSDLDLVNAKQAGYDTHVILVKQIKYEAGKTSFAVHFSKYKHQTESKMLTFSESDSKWLAMKAEHKENFFANMAQKIVQQLEIEADLRRGEKLEKGYFSNFGKVVSEYKVAPKSGKPKSVPRPKSSLEVDVVGEVSKTAPSNSSASPQKAIEDLVIAQEPKEQKGAVDMDDLLNQEVEDVDVEKLQQKFENLEFQMASAEPERKSEILTRQAMIYVQIGDTDEALVLLKQALEIDEDNKEAQKLRKKLLPPPPSIAERVRSFTKSKKMQLSFRQKYEYDSNIVLEAKDPVAPSNKDDAVYSASFGLGKFWGKGHMTNYAFFFDIHAENKNFDIMAHTLSHSWSKKLSDKLTLVIPVAFSHYSLENDGLLWTADLSPILMWKLKSNWTSTFELGYRDSTYFADANNGLEAEQTRLKVGFVKSFESKLKQNAKIQLVYLDEDTNTKSVAYQQIGLDLGYALILDHKLLDRLNVGALYHNRDYDEAAAGLAKRDDDRFTLKASLNKAIFDGQSLQLDFNWVDNDSNLNTSKYDKYKVGLGWNIIL